jgi:hypothetical protein
MRTRLPAVLLLLAATSYPFRAAAESLAISPAAFAANSAVAETVMAGSGGRRTSGEAGCEYAPVQLPHGAVIDALVFWVRDTVAGTGNDLTVQLWQKNTFTNAAATVVAQGSSSGSGASIVPVIAVPGGTFDVNALHETFYLEACYGAVGLELHHVKIDYTGPPSGIATGPPAVVPGAAFRSRSGRPAELSGPAGYVWPALLPGGLANDCLIAPLHLPDGVSITALEANLFDTSPGADVVIQLRRKRLNTNLTSTLLAQVSSTGTSGPQLAVTEVVTNPIVDHAYEYFLTTAGACPLTDGSHRIYAVRVDHTASLFADGFEGGDTSAWSAPAVTFETLLVPAPAFRPATSGALFTIHPFFVDVAALALAEAGCSYAPVTLPNGAELVLLTAYMVDNDPARNLTIRLYGKDDNAGSAVELGSATSSGSSGPSVGLDLLSGTVNTSTHHYYVEACRPAGANASGFGVQSVLVDYDAP